MTLLFADAVAAVLWLSALAASGSPGGSDAWARAIANVNSVRVAAKCDLPELRSGDVFTHDHARALLRCAEYFDVQTHHRALNPQGRTK